MSSTRSHSDAPITLLDSINTPADVRLLSERQLPQLCGEVREFLLKSVSQSSGHLASGLGTVELTVALHYVYATPYDQLVWDVGHQAYPHKILTGRKDAMHTIRQKNGLHPFPWRPESEYDTLSVGHSSTDRKSTRLNSSHVRISYAVFCLKKKSGCARRTRRLPLAHRAGAYPWLPSRGTRRCHIPCRRSPPVHVPPVDSSSPHRKSTTDPHWGNGGFHPLLPRPASRYEYVRWQRCHASSPHGCPGGNRRS